MLCISNLKPNCSRYPMYAILKLRINIWSIKKVILQGIITRWGIIFVGLHTMEIIAWSKSFCQSFGSKLHLLCIYIVLVNHKLYHEYTPGLNTFIWSYINFLVLEFYCGKSKGLIELIIRFILSIGRNSSHI